MKINIMGTGLSALLATHAAREFGHEVHLLDSNLWSSRDGIESAALLKRIPNTFVKEIDLKTFVVGDEDEFYRRAGSLREELGPIGQMHAWDPGQLYEELDDRYGWDVQNHWVTSTNEIMAADAVINASSAYVLCEGDECRYNHETAWESRVSKYEPHGVPNYIVGSGNEDDWWTLSWRVDENIGSYYQTGFQPTNARKVTIPTGTTCRCNPDVLRVGKYGTWDATERTENAYFKTIEWLKEKAA